MTMIARGDVIRDCVEKDIHNRFSEIAPVKSVRIVRDRGFAFVDFNTPEDAAKCLEVAKTDHIKIFGQPLYVHYSKSFKNRQPAKELDESVKQCVSKEKPLAKDYRRE